MRSPIVSKSERSGTGVDMANLSKAVCHGESDKCRFGNPPQESNFQRLGISHSQHPSEESCDSKKTQLLKKGALIGGSGWGGGRQRLSHSTSSWIGSKEEEIPSAWRRQRAHES